MHIRELNGKKICILGYGREGKAMAEALEKHAPGCRITIADEKSEIRNSKFETKLGKDWLKNLDGFDVVIKSPGIPPAKLSTFHLPLSSSTQIFLDTIADSGATVIGVTGSKGKSTTATLLSEILKKAGKDTLFVGNIGTPSIANIAHVKKGAIVVMEMSSYQLMELTVSPHVAVLTSFFPEHLDYHGSLESYKAAKSNITRHQKKGDTVFYHADFPVCKELANLSPGTKIAVTAKDAPLSIEQIKLKGKHNLGNVALAWKVAESLGASKESAIEATKAFTPLPHRLETVALKNGVEWINDSISTTPESAIVAVDTLGNRVETLILGGQDRGYDYSLLAKYLPSTNVKTVVLLPDSGATIGALIKKSAPSIQCIQVSTMPEAVKAAKSVAKEGSIVLLSPASPSYGHFRNFEDRGDQFRKSTGDIK